MHDFNQAMKRHMRGIVAAAVFSIFWIIGFGARAATLDFAPQAGAYAVGSQFSVDVTVSSPNQAVNAFSGTISFPKETLEVVSLGTTGSIVSLWAQEPVFSNANGTVSFEGAVLNPGYQGAGGRVVRLTLRAKSQGIATLGFSSASVLANDGRGTDVLERSGTATFSFSSVQFTPAPASETQIGTGTSLAPMVSSPTHPDSGAWYANPNPKFVWPIASDTAAVRLGYGTLANGSPVTAYAPPITAKQLENIKDGIWYFNVQLKNGSGWGNIAHFRFNIDTASPFINAVSVAKQTDPFDPNVRVSIDASDALSGILSYEFTVDTGVPVNVSPDMLRGGQYDLGPQKPGDHALQVRVFDKANNRAIATASFSIQPLASPSISSYSQRIQPGAPFSVEGNALPGIQIEIWTQQRESSQPPVRYQALADANGRFAFTTNDIRGSGAYEFWLVARAGSGAESMPTEKLTFTVGRAAFLEFGSNILAALAVFVPLVALAAVLFWLIWRIVYACRSWKRSVLKEIDESKAVLHRAVLDAYKDIATHTRLLEKTQARRALTREEEYMLAYFQDRLQNLERAVKKEIQDIEKTVNRSSDK